MSVCATAASAVTPAMPMNADAAGSGGLIHVLVQRSTILIKVYVRKELAITFSLIQMYFSLQPSVLLRIRKA